MESQTALIMDLKSNVA